MTPSSPTRSVKNRRPVLLVANSSWYLWHYRKLLLQRLQQDQEHVIALSPVDSTTPELSNLLIHIPWRIHRSTDSHPFFLGVSFFRMLLLVRAIKPRLIHSHTLKANLLVSIVSAFFGIPCVLSFAGMGRLSKSSGFSNFVFYKVLRLIIFFSLRQRCSRWKWNLSPARTVFIFQNEIDRILLLQLLPSTDSVQHLVIPGSGVPSRYLEPKKYSFTANCDLGFIELSRLDFIYCGRLLRSKGILTFLEISSFFTKNSLKVFGSVDSSSTDSLLLSEVSEYGLKFPNVEFYGNCIDPLLHLNTDFPVLIVPSSYGEGLPRAVLEALALSIPVIMSKSSTCGLFSEEIVYVTEGMGLEDYVRCINQLCADWRSGVLIRKLQLGREFVTSSLTEVSVVDQTLSAYDLVSGFPVESYLLSKDNLRLRDWMAQ